MLNFVRTFLIVRAQSVRLIAIEEVRNYGKIVHIKSIFENGWWEDAYPSSYSSGFAPGHKLQKPSEECNIFQSLGTISRLLFFLLNGRVKREGAWHNVFTVFTVSACLPYT